MIIRGQAKIIQKNMTYNENDTLTLIKNNQVNDSLISEIFQVLNQKEQNIISKRFGIGNNKRHTLEQIGQEYGITRERVRQIEKNALTKLKRISEKTALSNLLTICHNVILEFNNCLPEKKLLKEVINKTGGLFINDENIVLLSFEINSHLEKIKKSKNFRKTWFENSKMNKKQVELINAIGEKILKGKSQIINSQDYIQEIQTTLKNQKINFSKGCIASALLSTRKIKRVEEGYGLTAWRNVQPKSIKDKALIVLKRINKPLHFKNISKLIHDQKFDNKKVTIQAVHNELIRYEEFVLVGRGIYALREWGFSNGTVKDVILEILTEKGPLNKAAIIEEVLKRRQVKIGTISLNLQKYEEFKRIGRAVYSI